MFKWKLVPVTLFVFINACTTFDPTTYQEGLKIDKGESRFSGNAATRLGRAFVYSRLGAVDYCLRQNKLAFSYDSQDRTRSSTYTQVTSNTIGKETYISSHPVTLNYPSYTTEFECLARFNSFGIMDADTVSADTLHQYTQDFFGGVLIKKLEDGDKAGLKIGDVILSLNGHRVTDLKSLSSDIMPILGGKTAAAKVVRNGRVKTVSTPLYDLSVALLTRNLVEMGVACEHRHPTEPPIALCEKDLSYWTQVFARYGMDSVERVEAIMAPVKSKSSKNPEPAR